MAHFPSPEEILAFIDDAQSKGDGPPDRGTIARAFGLKGPDRALLRTTLKEMEEKGQLSLDRKKAAVQGKLAPVLVVDVTELDKEGDLLCQPVSDDDDQPPAAIRLPSSRAAKTKPPAGVGDRLLVRLKGSPEEGYTAHPLKVIGKSAERVLGVFHSFKRGGGTVEPVSRKAGSAYEVRKEDVAGAEDGDLVWIDVKNQRGYGPRQARIREVVGDIGNSANWSLIALAENEIPIEFPETVMAEADRQQLPSVSKHHQDLTRLPFVTIDPREAKDHDDAVLAVPNDKGWTLTVAIADVSWFVRPGSALDKEAQKRGNSVYLVDRVVPMLPERLSNDLCSLKAGKPRPALCCEMQIAPDGQKTSHRFFRAMIESKAGLSYEEAQAAADGNPVKKAKPLMKDVIEPLYAVYAAMREGRKRKAPLDLDLPERQIVLDETGAVKAVKPKARLDAHRLIETMMVAANVCAAETLEKAKRTVIYRVHDAPNDERLEGLRIYLEALGYSLPKGQVITPTAFNRLLVKAEEREEVDIVSMAILRAQAQAIYDTSNIGHFGLYLQRYAHFTSPIRRYADLTVHRGLVAAGRMGPGGAKAEDEAVLDKVAERISVTERRAISAERSTMDRFLSAYLENRLGAVFPARINGVTRSGVFVTLDETGADGFIPARTLGADYYMHDEATNSVVGKRTGHRYPMGMRVEVRLLEATPVQGGLRFEMQTPPLGAEDKPDRPRRRAAPRRGRKTAPKKAEAPAKAPAAKRAAAADQRQEKQTGEETTFRRRPRKTAKKKRGTAKPSAS